MIAFRNSGPRTLLALWVCLFLGGVIYLELEVAEFSPSTVPISKSAAIDLPALPAETAYEPPAFTEFTTASERPLFAPSRRPTVDAAPTVPTVAPQETIINFELVGVVISPTERLAIIRQNGATELQQVGLGRILNGWKLERIEPDYVMVRAGKTSRQVNLREDRSLVQETARERYQRERQEAYERGLEEGRPRVTSDSDLSDEERLELDIDEDDVTRSADVAED